MSEKKSISERIEVSGEVVNTLRRAIVGEALCSKLMVRHHLTDIQKGKYYPLKNYLSLLEELEKRMPTVLREAGKYISSEALLPPQFVNYEITLVAMNQGYYMNHRNVTFGEIGKYVSEKLSDTVYIATSTGPYPCVYDEGIYLGFAKKFGHEAEIEHEGQSCRRKGDTFCRYRIEV